MSKIYPSNSLYIGKFPPFSCYYKRKLSGGGLVVGFLNSRRKNQQLCDCRDISINQLASMGGIPHSSLDNIMNGRSKNPSIKMIMKIANALSISPAELINIPEINDYLKDGDPDSDSPPDSE